MKHRTIQPTHDHQAFKMDIDAVLIKHAVRLSAPEILALTAQVVGMTIAVQDKDTMTPDRALAIVMANIESGNAMALETIANPPQPNG